MYILLKTAQIWQVEGEFSVASLFEALSFLLIPQDVVVIGSYNPCDQVFKWLSERSNESQIFSRPYSDNFDLNRSDYPRGRAFSLEANPGNFSGLINLLKIEQGSLDKALFFDHLLCYRRSIPVVPLVNFHDAFNGGMLHLSGLYTSEDLQQFGNCLKSLPVIIDNPEWQHST